MSSILGRVEFSGRPIDRGAFSGTFETLKHYGPDLTESWVVGPVAVGRHLLRIAPASKNEHLYGPANDFVIVADAVIDNRQELATALGLDSTEVLLTSDTDLLCRSFARWGENCIDRLVGDFAFAVVRPRTLEVLLVRDHVGTRPLYWTLRDQTLIFSTSVETIVSIPEWKWKIDERTVAEYLVFPVLPVSKPFFENIQSVPPGGLVAIRQGRAVSRQWWSAPTAQTRRHISRRDAVMTARGLLETALRDRIATDGRVGAHLSGGLDSTGVAVLAARELRSHNQRLARGYAWSPAISDRYPENTARDERRRILELAELEQIPLYFGVADEGIFFDFLERPIEFEGSADLADEVPVLRAAARDNLRVMLSGWGGDEAFSAHGFGYLASLMLAGKFSAARNFARTLAGSRKNPWILLRLLWLEVLYPMLPRTLYHLLSPYRSYFKHGSFISDHLLQQHAELFEERRLGPKFGPDASKNIVKHVTAGHLATRMESWAAWSAPFGFQYRYPLTDKRLLEFLFALSPDQVFMGNKPRGLAWAVLADCLPSSTSKQDVANEQLRRDIRTAAWKTLAAQISQGGFSESCPWIDVNAFRMHAREPADQTRSNNVQTFVEIFAATRIWHLYQRALAKGWV